jgi:flavin reductase (DIM6/NTAB) family NADH-FMN oxidoreductase RutF
LRLTPLLAPDGAAFRCQPQRPSERIYQMGTSEISDNSAPILQNARAYFECLVRDIVKHGGDDAVVVMEVVEAGCRAEPRPLIVAASPWAYGG